MRNQKNISNIQDLIKFIALVTMMMDHEALYMDPSDALFRTIGRFTLPVFAFYAGYNFHGKIKHIIWILGAILVGMHIYTFNNFIPNVLISIAFGQLYLFYAGDAIVANESVFFRHFLLMVVLDPLTYMFMDYGTLVIALMMIGYKVANDRKKIESGYIILALLGIMIFNEYNMSQAFTSLWQAIGRVILVVVCGICLHYADHERPISVNLRPITRNMLFIYFFSIVIFIWVAYSRMYG